MAFRVEGFLPTGPDGETVVPSEYTDTEYAEEGEEELAECGAGTRMPRVTVGEIIR